MTAAVPSSTSSSAEGSGRVAFREADHRAGVTDFARAGPLVIERREPGASLAGLADAGLGGEHPAGHLARQRVRSSYCDRLPAPLGLGRMRHHAELTPEAAATGSPLLRASLAVAAPMLATGDDAQAHFDAAFDTSLAAWPLHRARLQLAYGMWLRRRLQAGDARAPLRSARDTFDALGAGAWAERARRELRAAGERSGHPAPRALDLLAPQELQIARLAAEGLSNREIGQQLYLSHRTVRNHLYRIFPKLGITSRAELAAVVGASPDPVQGH
jgi:DNA-binding CsgD family transcriptional regulator